MFNELNILRVFFEEPTREFNVREVARILKKAPATISKELKKLNREGLIRQKRERMLHLYGANIESEKYRDLKIYYNIRKLKEGGLIEALNEFYLKPTVVLFGSFSSGYDTETSDIDILIISESKKEFREKIKFEKKLKRNIQIFLVEDIKDLKNEYLINNVLNGIVLQGGIKWN